MKIDIILACYILFDIKFDFPENKFQICSNVVQNFKSSFAKLYVIILLFCWKCFPYKHRNINWPLKLAPVSFQGCFQFQFRSKSSMLSVVFGKWKCASCKSFKSVVFADLTLISRNSKSAFVKDLSDTATY